MNTIGDRLSYCRSTLRLTRKELCENWGEISVPSLSRWELDTVKIPLRKAEKLTEYFQKSGLNVSVEWILSGLGDSPYITNNDLLPKSNNFDSLCQETFLNLSKSKKNFSFHEVRGNFFSPILRHGDYIAGRNIDGDLEKNIEDSKLYFVIEAEVYVGFCKIISDHIQLVNHQGESKDILLSSVKKIGLLEWFAKRP